MDNIKAVFIDIDNTLLDFNKCALWSMQKAFNDYGLSFELDVRHLQYDKQSPLAQN